MDRLPLLETPRLRLRTIEADDVPALYAVFSDPRVMRYWSSAPLQELAEAAALQAEIVALMRADTLYQWGIERHDADGLIGTVTLYRLDLAHRRSELGFALGSAQWGRGFATEAVGAVIAHAFDGRGLHRLEADADPRNDASLHVLEKLGFRREGLARERYQLYGELQDSVLLGLLAPEWRARRGVRRVSV
jgi:RimJ/RimL family protein N-acetyltransferase